MVWKKLSIWLKGTIIVLIIFLLYFLSSIIIFRAAVSGKVLNAITKEPIEGIMVSRTVELSSFASKYINYDSKSNTDGKFEMPTILRFKYPFDSLDWDRVQPKYCDSYNYPNNICISDKRDLYADDKSLFGLYPTNNWQHLFKNGKLIEQGTLGRFSFFPIELDIYLIPYVESFEECEKAPFELRGDCRSLNALNLAIEGEDPELCEMVRDTSIDLWNLDNIVNSCLKRLATALERPEICNEINIEGVSKSYSEMEQKSEADIKSAFEETILICKRDVASISKNETLCNSLPKSIWQREGNWCEEEI